MKSKKNRRPDEPGCLDERQNPAVPAYRALREVHPAAGAASQWLTGEGEMARRIREFDWSQTPLGPIESWPQSLKAALSICIGSRFPIAIYWGPELVLLYNDAWSPIPGKKHPWALGRPAAEVWPEIWDVIEPLFAQVQTTGEATYLKDGLLLMHRHDYTEECYCPTMGVKPSPSGENFS